MNNVTVLRPVRFDPDSGIERISRASPSRVMTPPREQVVPAEGAEPVQLDLLYPSESLDGFLSRRLQPLFFHPHVHLPGGFRRALTQTRKHLQGQAIQHPVAARRLGKLSVLLDDHDELCGLARLYYAALLQG